MKKIWLFAFIMMGLNSNTITIYNNDLAYVSEEKNISIQKGFQSITYTNLPKSIIVNSITPEIKNSNIHLYSIQFNKSQSFSKAILESNLNKEVSFFAKDKKLLDGVLKKVEPIIVESNGRFFTLDSINSLVFEHYPKKERINSYLELKLSSKKKAKSKIELNYLITDISWFSTYTITLYQNSLNMKVWATITNKSDKKFQDYTFNLVAGELHRVDSRSLSLQTPKVKENYLDVEPVEPAVAEAPEVPSEVVEAYYLYRVPFRDTLFKNQTKEILLLDAKNIKYKIYGVAHNRDFEYYSTQKLSFSQIIEFENSSKNNLGVALPSGIARVYKKEFYLGEDTISNTPKNQKIKLETGVFFDVIGKKKILEYVVKKHYKKIKTQYTIENRSDKKQVVKIYEDIPVFRNKIKFKTNCQNSCSYTKENAFKKEYTITLEPKQSYTFYSDIEIFD